MTSSWQSRKRCSVLYDGSFPLHFLRRDEAVRLANPEHGSCELMSPRFGAIRIELGEIVERTESGGVSILRRDDPIGCARCSRNKSSWEVLS